MNRRTPLGKNRQRGSMGGIMFTLLIVAGAISMGSQLAPLYLDHNTMGTIMDKMSAEDGLGLRGDGDLRGIMKQRLKMNNIREFDLKENLKFDRSQRGNEMVLNYEVRIHLVRNLDMIATFDKQVLLRD
jgi:hypothetical protein